MSWQENFGREVEVSHQCPCCEFPYGITAVDYVGYSWNCQKRRHTSQDYIKALKKRAKPYWVVDEVNVQQGTIRVAPSDYPGQAYNGWGWSEDTWVDYYKKQIKEDEIGNENEFGEICP